MWTLTQPCTGCEVANQHVFAAPNGDVWLSGQLQLCVWRTNGQLFEPVRWSTKSPVRDMILHDGELWFLGEGGSALHRPLP